MLCRSKLNGGNLISGINTWAVVEEENLQDYERRIKEEKVKCWKEKALHGEFIQQTTDVTGLILAAQEQALKTNSIKHSIDKTSEAPLCRFCGESTETVRHIVSGCKKLAQNEYRKRHDKVALRVHWEVCRKYGIECTEKWYDHQPLPIVETGEVRVTWDMTIYTDKVLKHRPDITLVRKDTQKWTLIDIAVPADQNIIRTEEEKVEKYQDLVFKIRRIHGASKVTIIPIVIGALGSISKRAKTWYENLGVPEFIGTAHLLRKVLCL